jgi:hypothetical protein
MKNKSTRGGMNLALLKQKKKKEELKSRYSKMIVKKSC